MTIETQNDLTVVIPTFNRSNELKRALNSLVAQTDTDFNVIVCDDGSTEDIEVVISQFIHLLKLELVRIDNSGGPARPRNIATLKAKTKWISYLDSDDFWYPSRIARVKSYLNDDHDLMYHPLRVERADYNTNSKPPHGSQIGESLRTTDATWHMIRFGNPIATSGTIIKRDVIIANGGFDESPNLLSIEDFDAWFRLAANGARICFIPEILGVYVVSSIQISLFNKNQFDRQAFFFQHILELLPVEYHSRASSNFGYVLGSYAITLGLPNAKLYFRDLKFRHEPKRWLAANVKLILASITGIGAP